MVMSAMVQTGSGFQVRSAGDTSAAAFLVWLMTEFSNIVIGTCARCKPHLQDRGIVDAAAERIVRSRREGPAGVGLQSALPVCQLLCVGRIRYALNSMGVRLPKAMTLGLNMHARIARRDCARHSA